MPNDPFAEFDEAAADFEYSGEPAAPQAPVAPQVPASPQPSPAAAATPAVPAIDPELDAIYRQVLGIPLNPPVEAPKPAAPAAPAVPTTPETVPYDRFRQVTDEVRYLRGIIERQLGSPAGPASQAQDDDPPPEGYDPEVWAYMKPIREQVAALRQMVAPTVERVQREQAIASLAQSVPGFTPDMVQDMEMEFGAMPPAEQEHYRGRAGAEALAYRVVMRRQAAPPATTSPAAVTAMSNRAHSISRSGGMIPPVQRPVNINDLSDEQFEYLKALALRRSHAGLRDDEPDPILDGRF